MPTPLCQINHICMCSRVQNWKRRQVSDIHAQLNNTTSFLCCR